MAENKRTRRCALYARVSTDRQANVIDGSLDQQRDALQSDIQNRVRLGGTGDWQIHDLYVDEGESGKSLDRPAMQRMIADIRAGKVDTVITPKLDRISRSLPDFYILLKLFQENGVEFICLRERFDTTTSTGRAVLKMMLVFAELEREQTSERTKEAYRARAKKGIRSGGRVWGYDLNPERPGVYLVNDELKRRGWRLNSLQLPPALHFCITRPNTAPGVVDAFLDDLEAAVAYAQEHAGQAAESGAMYGFGGTVDGNATLTAIMGGYLDAMYDTAPAGI